MSPFMAAVVGFVLGESFTDPEIAALTVSESENLVYIRKAGGIWYCRRPGRYRKRVGRCWGRGSRTARTPGCMPPSTNFNTCRAPLTGL